MKSSMGFRALRRSRFFTWQGLYCLELWSIPLLQSPRVLVCACPQTLSALLILALGEVSCLNVLATFLAHTAAFRNSVWDSIMNFSVLQNRSVKKEKKEAHKRSLGCMWSIKLQHWSQSCKRRAKSRVALYPVWVNIPHLGSLLCTTVMKLIEHFNLQQAVLDVSCSLCTVSLGPSFKNTYPNFTSVLNPAGEESLVSKISLIHRDQ